MGCASSIYPKDKSANEEVRFKDNHAAGNICGPKSFTAEEIMIIKQTWNCLAQDMQGNGLQIFLRIFEICPTAKTLFFVDDVRHSEIARNAHIIAHGVRFMNAIGAVVENLGNIGDEGDKLSKLLILLGQQHRKNAGFKSEYFECFHEAMMWQWKHCIGNQFTPEISNAWSHLFTYVMEKLLEGY